MCGLAAISGAITGDDVALVRQMNRLQRHRGPDSEDLWQSPQVVLGQTRLAIVDLTESGRQPFVSRCGQVRVIYNGELYNHAALRRRYGLQVVSTCDGAILPELWCRLGPAMFAALRGMFAVVVHDARDASLTLARDRFGIKPLYWGRGPRGTVRVASEPRVLAQTAGRVTLSGPALRHYLAYGSLGRDMSPFSEIQAVPANGWVTLSRDGRVVASRKGQDLPVDAGPTSPRQLRCALVESVGAHLLSDVPVALLLSSGVDSSALAWGAKEAGVQLTCVTVGMAGGPREDVAAATLARSYGHEHVTVDRPPDEELLNGFFAAMQRPSIDGLNSYVISEAISSLNIKVALSGLGGDEVLGGYAHFRHLRGLPLLKVSDRIGVGRVLGARLLRPHLLGRLGGKGLALLARGGPRDAASYARLRRRVLLDEDIAQLYATDSSGQRADDEQAAGNTALDMSKAELDGYLGGTLLPDSDAFSMRWSVEMRVPYVDADFATAALAFDPRRGVGKRRLAEAIGDPLLIEVARQPKQGFSLPMDRWLRAGPLHGYAGQVRRESALVRSILAPDTVDDIVRAWEAGRVSWSRVWLLVALEGWLRSLDFRVDLP